MADGLLFASWFLSERLHAVEEPAELSVDVVLQRGREVLFLKEGLVPLARGARTTHNFVQVRDVKQN